MEVYGEILLIQGRGALGRCVAGQALYPLDPLAKMRFSAVRGSVAMFCDQMVKRGEFATRIERKSHVWRREHRPSAGFKYPDESLHEQ